MALTGKQKKYLRKHLRTESLETVAVDLKVEVKTLRKYLKKRLGKEKYKKIINRKSPDLKPEASLFLFDVQAWFRKNWQIILFLAFLVLITYANSLNNDFSSDDLPMIRDNLQIDRVAYFWKPPYFDINIRSIFIFLTHKFFGLNPMLYRLTNVLFHFGSTCLAYFLIASVAAPPIPLFAASLFAVHPILIESVTWISGGAYAISTFFLLGSLLAYLWAKRSNHLKLYLFSVFLAFLSAEKVITFPFIITMYEFCFGDLKINWKKLIPFWGIGGLWILLLFSRVENRIASLGTSIYQTSTGLHNPLVQIPTAVTSYLGLIFWPKVLTLYHSELAFNQSQYLLRLGVFLLFLAVTFYCLKKNRFVFFWLSLFLINLSPTLTPFKISWIVAERYAYFSTLGIIVVIALGLQKLGKISKKSQLSYLLFALVLIALSIRSIARNADWENQDSLWLASAKTSPSSHQNNNNLGDLYARRGDPEKAIQSFRKAIELQPGYADAYHNLANVFQQTGDFESATHYYQQALLYNPNLWQSHQNLAFILFSQGKFELAQKRLEKALFINPQNTDLYKNLAIIHLKKGEQEEARLILEKALLINPQDQKIKQLFMTIP